MSTAIKETDWTTIPKELIVAETDEYIEAVLLPEEMVECFLDYCIIYRDPSVEKASEHIYIPEDSQCPGMFGTIMDIGPGYFDRNGNWIPTTVVPGDRVLYMPAAGYNQDVGPDEYIMMRQFDCVGEDLAQPDPANPRTALLRLISNG